MRFLQVCCHEVQIEHGRCYLRVAEDSGEPNDIATVLQITRWKRMTQSMEAALRNLQSPEQRVVTPEGVPLAQSRAFTSRKEPIGLLSFSLPPLLPSV
jgi:hypothetical protein